MLALLDAGIEVFDVLTTCLVVATKELNTTATTATTQYIIDPDTNILKNIDSFKAMTVLIYTPNLQQIVYIEQKTLTEIINKTESRRLKKMLRIALEICSKQAIPLYTHLRD